MTNSTNKAMNAMITAVKKRYSLVDTSIVMNNQVAFDVTNEDVLSILTYLKNDGWRQLSMLTCVDWIAEGQFQLVYILMNWETGVRIQVRTRIPRDNPSFMTITKIYPGAQYYERDVHEFFGVVFEGNPDALKQLFLENWDDIPPMRKDFNSRAYSDRKYEKRTYKKDFSGKVGE
ncbi:MAG: NADH-quinone oxidoreductase subunit C [Vallitaleaceae bacterium]|nr:NADH-quinone oxidoreductase subunit C [Vallitaleaceae bacterium]